MHRLFIFRVGADAPLVAVVNPRIRVVLARNRKLRRRDASACRAWLVDVERPLHVRVERPGTSAESRSVLEASGLEARVIQHEMDHLDGVLILDRATRDQRKEAMRGPARRRGREHGARAQRQRPRAAGLSAV